MAEEGLRKTAHEKIFICHVYKCAKKVNTLLKDIKAVVGLAVFLTLRKGIST